MSKYRYGKRNRAQRQINSTDFVRALIKKNDRRPARNVVSHQETSDDVLEDSVFSIKNSLEIIQGSFEEIERLSEIVRTEINFIESIVDEIESVM